MCVFNVSTCSCLFIFFICLFVYLPNTPCSLLAAHTDPLYGPKSFSMHLKIFMNLNTIILLQQLSASSECCRNQPIESYLQTQA